MKYINIILLVLAVCVLASCDMRSGTAKKEMEKFEGTPTPTVSLTPASTPIDPAYIVSVDTSIDGDILTVNGDEQTKTITCTKYDQVMINGDRSVVTVNGACRKIVINGDGGTVTADSSSEFILNGSGNKVTYSRFANGKQPVVTQNVSGNEIERIPFDPAKKVSSNKAK